MTLKTLSPNQIEQIARILGDTKNGFTGTEIEHHLAQCRINDPNPLITKWRRLFNAFCDEVNTSGSTNIVYAFIQHCMEPVMGLQNPERYNWMQTEINKVLMLVGIEIGDDGQYHIVHTAETLNEVQVRTKNLRKKLLSYSVHPEVMKCCREELLAEDYFHAVLEAAKSLNYRVQRMSGLNIDGAELFQTAFSISNPYIALNSLKTTSERNQQNGLKEMLCGIIHMIRNVTAHELRIRWDINENDAIDILAQISFLHKYLDVCIKVPKY